MSPQDTNFKGNSAITTTPSRVTPTPATAGQRWRPPSILNRTWEEVRGDIDLFLRTVCNSLYSTSDTHQMNPVQGDILMRGSLPPAFNPSFTYTSTASSITWAWTNMAVYRADGSVTKLRDGSVTVSGLSGGTTYYFYPYYDEIVGDLFFLNIPPGIGTGGGGSIAYTARTSAQAQAQNLQHRVPLSVSTSTTAMSGTTGSSGTGGGR